MTDALEQEARLVLNTMLQACRGQDGDTLSCVLETIEAVPAEIAELRPRLVLFTQGGCPVCEEDKERYADMLAAGRIKEISADTPEGAAIMDANNLPLIPVLAVLDTQNKVLMEIEPPPGA